MFLSFYVPEPNTPQPLALHVFIRARTVTLTTAADTYKHVTSTCVRR